MTINPKKVNILKGATVSIDISSCDMCGESTSDTFRVVLTISRGNSPDHKPQALCSACWDIAENAMIYKDIQSLADWLVINVGDVDGTHTDVVGFAISYMEDLKRQLDNATKATA